MHNFAEDTSCGLYEAAECWLREDWERAERSLGTLVERFRGKRILVTGAAGFLGFNFLHFFSYLNSKAALKSYISLVAADNYLRGKPRWLGELTRCDPLVEVVECDVTRDWDLPERPCDMVLHCASVASPTYYRKFPLETMDANVIGLRNALEYAHRNRCESILYFSSSEIYGDPPSGEIPTKEDYRGNVASLGPRACYDESKRMGETMCWIFAVHKKVPVKIVRPFNNYGPGLSLMDRRVLPDFCRDALRNEDIVLHSDGSPTRTFCYSSDALDGYLRALLSPYNGEPFNIGAELPEISMRELAQLVLHKANAVGKVVCKASADAQYLTDNPLRRCPDISKARTWLGYAPTVSLEEGIGRLLYWYRNFAAVNQMEQGAHAVGGGEQ